MRSLLFGICLLAPGLCPAADQWHTFTATDGRSLYASVERVGADYVIVKLQFSGMTTRLDFNKLSPDDVEFLKNYTPLAGAVIPDTPGTAKTPTPAADPTADTPPEDEPTVGHLYPRTRKEIKDGIHEIEKRPQPKEISKAVHEATTQLNIYRFLCGVPANVKGDATFSKNAEDAALACKRNGALSHGLGHSTDKCNISTIGNVVASVAQYIEDSGANNRDVRGHRGWCLNPPMGKVGFGSGGDSYSAMWCMDGSGKAIRGTWSYPGKGLFPVEYMHGNAWSLYGAGKPASADKLKIEVIKLSKRPDHTLPASGEIPGHSLKINHVSLGMNSAINFEPEDAAKRGIYWVRVSGEGIHEGYVVELY